VATLLAAAAAAHAQEPGTPAEPPSEVELFKLEGTLHVKVESATLSEQDATTVPSVISVMTEQEISVLGLRTLRDALMLMAGVTVLDTQSGGHVLAIRGVAQPANILVTLDGMRLNDFYDGTFFADLPLENIERIELIRGPGSALYGTNAFSGVVSLFSKARDEIAAGAGGEALFDHSVGGGGRAHGRFTRTIRDWTLSAFGSFWETTGPRVLVERDNSAGTAYSKVPGQTDGRRRLGMAQISIQRARLITRSDVLELGGTFLFRRHRQFFGPNDVFAPNGWEERTAAFGFLEYRTPLPRGVSLRLRAELDRRGADALIQDQPENFYRELHGNFVVEPGELFPEGQLRTYRYHSYRVAFKPQVSWDLQTPRRIFGNTLTVGAELAYEWMPSFSYAQNYRNDEYVGALQNYDALQLSQRGKDRLLVAAFVHDQLQALRNLWITVGMRFDYYSDFGFAWSPRAALVWRAHPKVAAKVLYGRAFRAPTFQELYDQTNTRFTPGGYSVSGNDKLQPETTDTLEAGLELGPFGPASFRANGFYVRTNNTIELDPTFNFAGTTLINFPGREIGGFEAEIQLFLNEQNYWIINGSFFRSRQIGQGLAGFETDSERRFVETDLSDLPEGRLSTSIVSRPFSRLKVPAILAGLRAGARYSFISESHNNGRFTYERINRFSRPAWHELGVSLTLPLVRDRLDFMGTFEYSFDRAAPLTLNSGPYSLPTQHGILFLGLRGRL
jgi:outer membrane receptor protein involved in Fe transport